MVKLDKIDKKLLYELDKNARTADTILAKRIGRSRESVRYRIDQLTKKGVIRGFSTIVDMSKLGYQGYKLYATLSGKQEFRDQFREYIKTQKNVLWLGVSEGAWDIGVMFFARHHQEFHEQKNKIISKFHSLILRKNVCLVDYLLVYPKKFLTEKKEEPVRLLGVPENEKKDEKDRKILDVLRHNARISLVRLAQQTGYTIDIVRGRMRKLEEKGIIVKYTVDVDYNVLGLQLFKVFLYFKYCSSSTERKLVEYCKQKKEVISFARQIAQWDVELEVMAQSFQDFNKFIRLLKDEFHEVLIDTESANVSEDYWFPGEKVLF